MTTVNQNGDPVFDQYITEWSELNEGELQKLVLMLIHHLGLVVYRTNATKHGNTELQLREGSE